MKRIAVYAVLASFMLVCLSGCIFILGGAAGALGAYGVSRDTVQGETDKPYGSIWNAALEVCRIRGAIKQENSEQGYIEADMESSHVWIRVIRLTRATTRVRIAARKHHFPNLELAQDMYVKVMDQAR